VTIFPERLPICWLSYWNQARRLGIIKIISLGPTHHNGVMGYMDGERTLPMVAPVASKPWTLWLH
jgi:hypothetical protein